MDDNLAAMSGDLQTITGQMNTMNTNIQRMKKQITDMKMVMGYMAGNVNQISKAMKISPFQ